MKVTVVEEKCIGCGLCAQIASDVYQMQNGKAVVKTAPLSEEEKENANRGKEACPVSAIEIS